MAKKWRPSLSQGLRQRAKVTGHLLRYLVCVREVLLKELVVRVIVICSQQEKHCLLATRPAERRDPPLCFTQSRSLVCDTNTIPISSLCFILCSSFFSLLENVKASGKMAVCYPVLCIFLYFLNLLKKKKKNA